MIGKIASKWRRWPKAVEAQPVPNIWSGYTQDALQLANIIDCDFDDLMRPQQNFAAVSADPAARVCNWYLPPFDNPFYGGVMTILRLADSLARDQGMRQRFLICGGADEQAMRAKIASAFPALAASDVQILDSADAIQAIPFADYSIATLWTTAYVLLRVCNTGLKFYMIQDFEPAFYPAGSTYAQAELTYRFGFLGICNTVTLKRMYEDEYGGSAVVLKPTVDRAVFFPDSSGRSESADVRRLFYYARPGTPRNGFELAAAALRQVKVQLGDRVEIVCAGVGWNPSEYGLDGVVQCVGLLPYAQTADLYRSCHVGFVMMMTRHPSYLPFELMACGTTVVTNYNEANTWLLRDGENCLLSPPTSSCLAATLVYALTNHEALRRIRETARDDVCEIGDWTASLAEVADFMRTPPGSATQRPFAHQFRAATKPI
ncbi:glycosyltransferase family 4 protein [Lysobacter sp. HA35]